jgi:hypothetical protein
MRPTPPPQSRTGGNSQLQSPPRFSGFVISACRRTAVVLGKKQYDESVRSFLYIVTCIKCYARDAACCIIMHGYMVSGSGARRSISTGDGALRYTAALRRIHHDDAAELSRGHRLLARPNPRLVFLRCFSHWRWTTRQVALRIRLRLAPSLAVWLAASWFTPRAAWTNPCAAVEKNFWKRPQSFLLL